MRKDVSNDQRIDTLLHIETELFNPVISFDRTNTLGNGVEITYNFPSGSAKNDFVFGFQALSTTQRNAIRDAMDVISSFIDVTFREVPASSSAQIEYAVGELGSNIQGTASSSFTGVGFQYAYIKDVTITFDNSIAGASDLGPGSRFFFVALHEIGHGLGLDHPFNDFTLRDKISGINSNTASTIMAYGDGFTGTSLEPSTIMRSDFLALQYLYGENTSTFAGNTVHRFTDEDFRGDESIRLLWDASGNDTINLSGVASASSTSSGGDRYYEISLEDGDRLLREPSSNSQYDNIFIAEGASFENLVATQFDDRITGTTVANRLEGGNGEDVINGGTGNDHIYGDSFVYSAIVEDPDSLTDVDGWLYKFAGADGAQAGNDNTQTGQALNTFFGIDNTTGGIGVLADDNSADVLFGGAGSDVLSGGGGADQLTGGTGNDTLTGGAAADEFVFGANDGDDVITDFNTAQDALQLSRSNWFGDFTAQGLVDEFGIDTGTSYVLDFGGTRIEILGDFTSAELAATIEIV